MTLDGELARTAEGGSVVTFNRVFNRSPERIFKTLSDPMRIWGWLGDADVELRVGGAISVRFRGVDACMSGTITKLEPGRLIEYTWLENYGMPASVVRWEVQPAGEGCRVTLRHTFPPGCELADVASFLGGWHGFLDAIPDAADGLFVPYTHQAGLLLQYAQRHGVQARAPA